MIQQIVFAFVTLGAFGFAIFQFMRIRKIVLLGKEENISGNSAARWRNVFLVAFGQGKMFKRWVAGVFHLFIYVAFLLTQIELIEILIDEI